MSDLDSTGVKAIITVGGLLVIAGVAFVISRIVRYCVKDFYTDGSEDALSESTKNIIRARLTLIQFKRGEIQKNKRKNTLSMFRKWHEIVQIRKKDRVGSSSKCRQNDLENGRINVTEVGDTNVKLNGSISYNDAWNVKENGNVVANGLCDTAKHSKENGDISDKVNSDTVHKATISEETGTPRMVRFPSFAHNTSGGGAATKSAMEAPRTLPSRSETQSPVPRGRPVSSKTRAQANVTLTNVETVSPPTVQVKTVHFEKDIINNKETAVNIETVDKKQNADVKINMSDSS